jgi:hypothetical protein
MTIEVFIQQTPTEVVSIRLEGMDSPKLVQPGVYQFQKLGGQPVMTVQPERVVRIMYSDNTVELAK